MADICKIKLPNNSVLNIKDSMAKGALILSVSALKMIIVG